MGIKAARHDILPFHRSGLPPDRSEMDQSNGRFLQSRNGHYFEVSVRIGIQKGSCTSSLPMTT